MLFLSFLLRIVRRNPAEPGINLLCNNHSPYTIPRLFVEIKWFFQIITPITKLQLFFDIFSHFFIFVKWAKFRRPQKTADIFTSAGIFYLSFIFAATILSLPVRSCRHTIPVNFSVSSRSFGTDAP